MTPRTSKRGRRVLPEQCIIQKRAKAALDSGLEGNERREAHRWLGGLKMLTTFAGEPIEVRFREIGDSQRALLESMGVTVLIDPDAPPPYRFPAAVVDREIRIRDAR